MTTPSKLHPKFQAGVVVISGLWGLGNSTLAFTAERPQRSYGANPGITKLWANIVKTLRARGEDHPCGPPHCPCRE